MLWKKRNQSGLGGKGEGRRSKTKMPIAINVSVGCQMEGAMAKKMHSLSQQPDRCVGLSSVDHRATVTLGPLGGGATAGNWLLSKQRGQKSVFTELLWRMVSKACDALNLILLAIFLQTSAICFLDS